MRTFIDKIARVLESSERKAFDEIGRIVNLATSSVTMVAWMIEAEMKGDLGKLDDYAKKIYESEKRADDITKELMIEIAKGALASGVRENLIELIQKADDILDLSHVIARDIVRISRHSPLRKGSEIIEILEEIVEMARQAIRAVVELSKMIRLASECGECSIDLALEIEEIEERIDDRKEEILDMIYEVSRYLDCSEFFHFVNLVHRIDDITDFCEDASNSITAILKGLS